MLSTSRALPIDVLFGPESLRKKSGLNADVPECRPETLRYRLASGNTAQQFHDRHDRKQLRSPP